MALNQWVGIGRVVKDPDLKYTQNGKPVVNFAIAVNRPYSKDNEREADFINIVAWDGVAEFVTNWFKKGEPIQVIGRIQTRKYEDKSGNPRVATQIVASSIEFVEGNKKSAEGLQERQKATEQDNGFSGIELPADDYDDDSDLPF